MCYFYLPMIRCFTLLILVLTCACATAQEMPINGADITQCGGFLVDDGFSSSNYSNNQNQSITICALAPETIVNLYFTVCALGAGDYLEIHDGPDTTSPLIGTYYGTDLQTTDITSTNASGCLTVHFFSDNAVVGNFAAEISCGPPCERPFAVVNTNQNPYPVLLCPGEEITFEGGASTFASGASLQSFEWIFDDGSTNSTDWPNVTHAFDNPGVYEVQLKLTDNNDCNNNNLTDYVILVSTYPDFSLLSPNFELCQGGIEYLGVNFFIPDSIYGNDSLSSWIDVPYIPLPDVDFGGALYIPDDQSECFSSELTFSGFSNGAVIDEISDFNYFFINFEHSFMGDLVITFICPNGQSIAVHQQSGGGTFLGQPIDDESGAPGVGYDYYWSPNATNGTWANNAGATLPAGTYESQQGWDVLLGCPLNGTWTVEVCDMWALDDGYIFDWSMSFDPELYGELYTFTPVYGADCDSSYWTGPFIIDQDENCDFAGIEINTTGSYDYTYTVTNNFGCTFDTTITVNVYVASPVTAGPDMVFSCDPIQLTGGIDITAAPDCDNAAGTYDYCLSNNEDWIQTICPDVVGDGVTAISIDFVSGEIGAGDQLFVYNGPSTGSPLLAGPISGDLADYFFTSNNAEGCLTILVQMDGSGSCSSGEFAPFTYEVVCGDSEIPYVWQWTPANNLSNGAITNPMLNSLSGPTEFILSGYPQGYPGCVSSDTLMVTLDSNLPNAGLDAEIDMCLGEPAINMTEQLGGTPTPGGTWYNSGGISVLEIFDSSIDPMGVYEYIVTLDGCVFSAFLDISINGPEIFVSNDTTVCLGGTAILQAWTDPANTGLVDFYWTDGEQAAENVINPSDEMTIGVYASDGNLCVSDTAYTTVTIYDALSLELENDSTICPNLMALAEIDNNSGGVVPYTFIWTANGLPIGSGTNVPFQMQDDDVVFCATMTDACETPAAQDCMTVEVAPAIDIIIEPLWQADCSPFTATVSILTDQSLYSSASWQFSNGASSTALQEGSATFMDPGFYDLEISLRNQFGCVYTETFNDIIQVYTDPYAAWNATPLSTDLQNTNVQFINYSQGDSLTYSWDFGVGGGGDISTLMNPSFAFPTNAGDEYTVTLGVTDDNGCYSEVQGLIDINDLFHVWVPNSFTPNNDELNDVIFVSGSDISADNFEWIIFDRWGQVVFRSTDPLIPWKGEINGGAHFAQDGVYSYILKIQAETHIEEMTITGHITLVR